MIGTHMTDEAHYDTPWEFVHRNASSYVRNRRPRSESTDLCAGKRPENIYPRDSGGSPRIPVRSTSRGYLAEISQTPSTSVQHSCNFAENKAEIPRNAQENSNKKAKLLDRNRLKLHFRMNSGNVRHEQYREADIIHDNMDRTQAEAQLCKREVGCFLVRRRNDGNLALSIRASTGVLHIKLERKGDRWILGEGPSFGSVSTIISFYRSHELPIRGAQHILLKAPVTAVPLRI
ncbi:hypothetical protein AB6A40_000766 [Gnathostoma spinigerum]|uniref:SH2 domain-containing protein n=1 Tax=Gnathostoma spinigerum TaxID=75299 RepID=A0ABD6EBJ9_9BILA